MIADLAILIHFLRSLLLRSVFTPLERIGEHAERIAGGAYDPTIPPEAGEELDRLIRHLNTMAEKFISDQQKLSNNVRSLDRTNQEFVATTEELVRAARLASVGTLASGVAHEVGNPLGALMGCLDVLKRRARPEETSSGRSTRRRKRPGASTASCGASSTSRDRANGARESRRSRCPTSSTGPSHSSTDEER